MFFLKLCGEKSKVLVFYESEFSALRFVLHVVKEKLTFVYASVDQLKLNIKKKVRLIVLNKLKVLSFLFIIIRGLH